MHITLEADYALRIVDTLARSPDRMKAKAISEIACVTLRFSLKILRKLTACGIVRSYQGVYGGYELAKPMEEISVYEVLESIDGPLMLNRCVLESGTCNRTPDKKCPYHHWFVRFTDQMRAQLSDIKIANVVKGSEVVA